MSSKSSLVLPKLEGKKGKVKSGIGGIVVPISVVLKNIRGSTVAIVNERIADHWYDDGGLCISLSFLTDDKKLGRQAWHKLKASKNQMNEFIKIDDDEETKMDPKTKMEEGEMKENESNKEEDEIPEDVMKMLSANGINIKKNKKKNDPKEEVREFKKMVIDKQTNVVKSMLSNNFIVYGAKILIFNTPYRLMRPLNISLPFLPMSSGQTSILGTECKTSSNKKILPFSFIASGMGDIYQPNNGYGRRWETLVGREPGMDPGALNWFKFNTGEGEEVIYAAVGAEALVDLLIGKSKDVEKLILDDTRYMINILNSFSKTFKDKELLNEESRKELKNFFTFIYKEYENAKRNEKMKHDMDVKKYRKNVLGKLRSYEGQGKPLLERSEYSPYNRADTIFDLVFFISVDTFTKIQEHFISLFNNIGSLTPKSFMRINGFRKDMLSEDIMNVTGMKNSVLEFMMYMKMDLLTTVSPNKYN